MVPFIDLRRADAWYGPSLRQAIDRVLASSQWILGPEVRAFEEEFARFLGVGHAVGVASGTDAVELALRAVEVGPGDEVITVSHTAVGTVCAVQRAGAIPVLVDIDAETLTIEPAAVEAAITSRTRAIVAVHLYGHPADIERLASIADRHHLALVEDAAQACGARWKNRPIGSFGTLAAFSFYPTKTLGAIGDGGAVATNDPRLAQRVRRLRFYGQAERGHSLETGMNSRLDELQAAILRVKLAHLADLQHDRQRLARRYAEQLTGVKCPRTLAGAEHAWHLYVVRHAHRDALADHLQRHGVATLVHYDPPLHRQPAHAAWRRVPEALPQTESAARQILSLPLFAGMSHDEQSQVIGAVAQFQEGAPA